MTQETWKPVVECPDGYEVSSLGRVRTLSSDTRLGYHGLLRLQIDQLGYVRVMLRIEGKQRNRLVHRLVALAFLGLLPAGYEVNHKDGEKTNNSVGNLEYVTRSQNMHHAYHTLGRQHIRKYQPLLKGTVQKKFRDPAFQQAVVNDAVLGTMTLSAIASKHGIYPETAKRILAIHGVSVRASALYSNSTTKQHGISWYAKPRKWIVRVVHGGKRVYGGCFSDIEDAISARDAILEQK